MKTRETAPAAEIRPDTPVQFLKGAGPRRAQALARLEVLTVEDLLHHFPRSWADRSRLKTIRDAVVGEEASLEATVLRVDLRRLRGRQDTVVTLEDGTGLLQAVWFGQPYMKRNFKVGDRLMVSGPVGFYDRKRLQNPEWEVLTDEDTESLNVGRIVPIYPSTAGLSQRVLRTLVRTALDQCLDQLPETLPAWIREEEGLPGRREALAAIHFPATFEALGPARKRLVFEEALEVQMLLRWLRLERETRRPGIAMAAVSPLAARIEAALPFRLTDDQRTALAEIVADMARPTPMGRLLQGDVGSGKTIVALLAAAHAVDAGYQAAFLAPTEVLAEQHRATFRVFAEPHGVTVARLTGAMKKAERTAALADVASGAARIVVGTHALLQEGVEFHALGLIVVDEQHRFGVLQRSYLKSKGRTPDLLAMTATPIPRTLYLTRAADLSLSQIRSRPAGRGRVITRVTGEENREKVYDVLAREIGKGRQVYVVYPIIEESEKIDLKDATRMFEALRKNPRFARARTGLLHGRLKAAEKAAVLDAFRAGQLDLLVTTTVIEVGIDVPNATVMVIEHPERFGLSQLHQLRGRIGRGSETSYCILIEEAGGGGAHGRLELFAGTTDGFALAEADLRFRGAGSILGVRQHGPSGSRLRILDPVGDAAVLEEAWRLADRIAGRDAQLLDPEWRGLRTRLLRALEESRRYLDAG
jgi:ATP-dependent DNA helicase RecG